MSITAAPGRDAGQNTIQDPMAALDTVRHGFYDLMAEMGWLQAGYGRREPASPLIARVILTHEGEPTARGEVRRWIDTITAFNTGEQAWSISAHRVCETCAADGRHTEAHRVAGSMDMARAALRTYGGLIGGDDFGGVEHADWCADRRQNQG